MKIKPEHVEYLQQKIDGFIARNKDQVDKHVAEHTPKRVRWDLLRAAVGFEWVCDNLYPYLNDVHIDTALRHVCKH